MFKHIVTDAKKIAQQARSLAKVKEAHRWILQLSRPLADITDLINENITALRKHHDFLENAKLTKREIEENLYVPKICLQVNELKQPITVCTSAQCCEFYTENNKKKHCYKKKCHDPCFLNNIPWDIIGSPELMYCAAMNTQYYCKKCSCHFSKHMHVLYLTRKTEEHIHMDAKGVAVVETEQKLRLLLKRIQETEMGYKSESEKIVKIMAKFSHFLKQHGFCSDNDSYEKYLLHLISREVKYGADSDMSLIKHYKSMLKDYREEKANLEAFLGTKKEENSTVPTEEIFEAVNKLFELVYTGQQLKNLHEVQMKCTMWNEKKDMSATSSSEKKPKQVTLMEP